MRKKVLILGHNDATQFIDVFNQYVRLFDPDKFEVTVAYLTGAPNDDTEKRTIAEKVMFLNVSKKSIRGLKIGPIKKLLGLCRENNYEIVICHRYKPSYIMMWVAQFCKIPALVFVMHELKTMSSIARQLLIATLRRSNMLFAGVSNAVRDDMRKSLWCVPDDRIITLYNMIDIELTEPQLLTRKEARIKLDIDEDTFLFGNLARLAPNKDHQTLIRAFALIKPSCPKAKLIIMGDGELESELKEQVRVAGLAGDVIFAGYVNTAYIYMKAFDCFVLSSTQEAFGRVLLEAMIARLPVIATSVNGIPEVVGTAGTLIKAKDAAAFSSAMKNIFDLSAAERNKLGDIAYQHAQENYSIPTFQKQFWQQPLVKSIKE